MAIATLPDITGAIMLRLRSITAITALTANRIATERGADWFPDVTARHAIVINGPVGSPGDDYQIGIQRTRYDFLMYGASGFEAMRLYRTAHPNICPRQDSVVAFVQSGCRVRNVVKEGGPTRLNDPDTNWAYVLCSYIYTWSEFPV